MVAAFVTWCDDNRSGAPMSSKAARLLDELSMFGGKLGLEAITSLLARLGNPEAEVPFVLVAGTNGKGSTAAMLSAIATTAGYRVGLYTSPHLERPEERIRVDGHSISTAEFGELLETVTSTNREEFGVLPSYFEATTAVARLHFARQECDLAVMEVGLGGRLDATNTGTPVLSVITSISFDHQMHLGDRLEQIALEKAGHPQGFSTGSPVDRPSSGRRIAARSCLRARLTGR